MIGQESMLPAERFGMFVATLKSKVQISCPRCLFSANSKVRENALLGENRLSPEPELGNKIKQIPSRGLCSLHSPGVKTSKKIFFFVTLVL
jgi:hypothetical protein